MKIILETERLLLRELVPDDKAFILNILNTPGWLRFIGDRGVRTEADAENYLRDRILKGYETNGFGLWLMVPKSGDPPAGMCGLIRRDGLDDVDIGFALLPEFYGLGFASEAARAVMDFFEKNIRLPRVVAIVTPDNERSINVLSKIGLQFEKEIRLPDDAEKLLLFGKNF